MQFSVPKPSVIILSSGNAHKIVEIGEALNPLGIELKSNKDYPEFGDVEETEKTLEGNALLKARAMFRFTGLPSLADDTGLEVSALNGEPGVFSARYAGENATFEDNVNKLLREMNGKTDRAAAFRTVLALVTEDGEFFFDGVCEGRIINEPKGDGGFGYDPVFMPDGWNMTFAEMSVSDKNAISHRGRAVKELTSFLKALPA